MRIAYLIGNGFDLNLGLKTSYKDFYEYYLKLNSDNDHVLEFKKELSKNMENWSDLERELGEYSTKFSYYESDAFISLLDDIQDALVDYLKIQQDLYEPLIADINKVYDDIFCPEKYLTEKEKDYIEMFKKTFNEDLCEVDVIVFNYTNTFEKIVNWSGRDIIMGIHGGTKKKFQCIFKNLEHIHGTVDKDMLMGVNDLGQISNKNFEKNQDVIDALVKPMMNKLTGSYREEKCENAILKADIICIFGMSLGITDRKWWELINQRMVTGKAVTIIFSKNDSIKLTRYYRDKHFHQY